jgi:phage terminase large subunit-like protein
LRGLKTDDSIFAVIYELDKDDDWEDKKNWKKCCPSLGITVTEDYMERQLLQAKNNTSDETAIKTKTFNIWCQTQQSWLPQQMLLDATQKVDLEELSKEDRLYGYCGVDLASTSDLTSLSLAFQHNDKYYFKSWIFIPESALEESPNKHLYHRWKQLGMIEVTPGNATDYDYILNKIMEINKVVIIDKICYDKWNSTQFTINATEQGLPMVPYSQSLGNFNRPTKEFERLLRLGKVVIDNNEVVRWCFSNSTIKTDWNENAKAVKGGNKNQKIDCVISMLEALGGMIEDPSYTFNLTAL